MFYGFMSPRPPWWPMHEPPLPYSEHSNGWEGYDTEKLLIEAEDGD